MLLKKYLYKCTMKIKIEKESQTANTKKLKNQQT